MAETISQFLASIEDERKRGLAQKAQTLIPYLQQLQAVAQERETLDKHRKDYMNMAAPGSSDQEMSELDNSLKNAQTVGGITDTFGDWQNRTQASRILTKGNVQYDPNLTTAELGRMAQEQLTKAKRETEKSLKNEDKAENYDEKAKTLGVPFNKLYQKKIVELGGDKALAFGETARLLDKPKGGGGKAPKAEKPNNKPYIVKVKNMDYVFFKGTKGQTLKARVYEDENGVLRYVNGGKEVEKRRLLTAQQVDTTEHATAQEIKATGTSGKSNKIETAVNSQKAKKLVDKY